MPWISSTPMIVSNEFSSRVVLIVFLELSNAVIGTFEVLSLFDIWAFQFQVSTQNATSVSASSIFIGWRGTNVSDAWHITSCKHATPKWTGGSHKITPTESPSGIVTTDDLRRIHNIYNTTTERHIISNQHFIFKGMSTQMHLNHPALKRFQLPSDPTGFWKLIYFPLIATIQSSQSRASD